MFKRIPGKRKYVHPFSGYFFIWVLVSAILPFHSFSQDKIYKTDSTVLQTKVQEVGDNDIKYKKFSNLNGPVYTIKKSEVWMIVYENGEKEVYNVIRKYQKPAPAKEKPVTHTAAINTVDQQHNEDLVILSNGDNIYCTIDYVNGSIVSYHIKKLGMDPKGTADLDEVVRYFFKQQWFYGNGVSSDANNARAYLLEEKVNDAISAYFRLISVDSANAGLLAEDAFALALGGIYDAALMRLDRARSLAPGSPLVNYYISRVFALIGYDDLSDAFLKVSGNFPPPAWIASASADLTQKYKRRSAPDATTREELIFDFKKANELAARDLNIQSIAMFHKLVDRCPNEYILYAGFSIPLEKTGALEASAARIGEAISLLEKSSGNNDKIQALEQRLESLKRKIRLIPPDAGSASAKKKGPDAFRPQMMAYAGGTMGPSMISISGRFGYYLSGSSNASFDFGVTQYGGQATMNLGLSAYIRQHIFVTGAGIVLTAGETTNLSIKISVGISKIGKNQYSSFDVFLDGTTGVAKGSITTVGLTIGKSIYFGRRK